MYDRFDYVLLIKVRHCYMYLKEDENKTGRSMDGILINITNYVVYDFYDFFEMKPLLDGFVIDELSLDCLVNNTKFYIVCITSTKSA